MRYISTFLFIFIRFKITILQNLAGIPREWLDGMKTSKKKRKLIFRSMFSLLSSAYLSEVLAKVLCWSFHSKNQGIIKLDPTHFDIFLKYYRNVSLKWAKGKKKVFNWFVVRCNNHSYGLLSNIVNQNWEPLLLSDWHVHIHCFTLSNNIQ